MISRSCSYPVRMVLKPLHEHAHLADAADVLLGALDLGLVNLKRGIK